MARFPLVIMLSLVTIGLAASAQTIQVSRDNKTKIDGLWCWLTRFTPRDTTVMERLDVATWRNSEECAKAIPSLGGYVEYIFLIAP